MILVLFASVDLLTRMAQGFTEAVDPQKWARCERYAIHVKSLTIPSNLTLSSSDNIEEFEASVFDEIAESQRRLHILPKLNRLTVLHADRAHPWFLCPSIFLHENLESLTIDLPKSVRALPSTRTCLKEIVSWSPRLTTLRVYMRYPVAWIEEELSRVLRGLHGLQNIEMSSGTLSSKIISSVALLPRLRTISLKFGADDVHLRSEMFSLDAMPILSLKPFPSLNSLIIQGRLRDLTPFFSSTAFNNLQRLSVDCLFSNNAVEVKDCIYAVSFASPATAFVHSP